jgi:phage gp16-like protein
MLDRRKRLIAAVHAGARRLGLDEETRRAMQARITGHRSCAEMTEQDLERVLDHLRRAGFRRRRPAPAEDRAPLVRKVYALLGDRPVAYAEGILRHMYGKHAPHRLEWANPSQLRKVVAALEYDRRRHPCR